MSLFQYVSWSVAFMLYPIILSQSFNMIYAFKKSYVLLIILHVLMACKFIL